MARASVNIVVLAGSAATLAASMAGIARSEGYFDASPAENTAAVAKAAADARTALGAQASVPQIQGAQIQGLSPLPPLHLSAGRPLNIPQSQLDIQGLTQLSGGATSLTAAAAAPSSAPAAASSSAPAQPVAPAPALVAPPPPPPAPAPAPAVHTRAS